MQEAAGEAGSGEEVGVVLLQGEHSPLVPPQPRHLLLTRNIIAAV